MNRLNSNPLPPNRETVHQLKELMQKEVSLMREILANMHEEELSLLAGNKGQWELTMQQRSDMIADLGNIRKERIITGQKTTSSSMQTLEKLLPVAETLSSEILSLLDQIMALVDRMNLQNARNDSLFYQAKNLQELPLRCPYPPPQLQPRARRKTAVMTRLE
jgi:hypothetical protein